ncbi:hypothetical protein [uncultured Pseudoalteromonas sp.]|uniref:hypothetical protein n=1 Tax=uncultured Pseudoalteromonas sp. TaxID=114053 RepID=UPI000C5DEFC7|nr:hypothetical protein [uncultured Pseudoalteromonas sp.]MBD57037.1 hypothetical protein [Pseudoalteromonas sp.]|tara:strand:- start:5399 stop:7801 length:2403 start_codon:yes stop_codon:yes gene_type:complete
MRKSILANKSQKPAQELTKENLESIDFNIVLIVKRVKVEINLARLIYHKCNTANNKISSRIKYVRALLKSIKSSQKVGASDNTIENHIRQLQYYITFCDCEGLDAFSKEGYLAYVGNWGYLRSQVNKGRTKHPYIFMYSDGESIGLTEASAASIKGRLDVALKRCEFNVIKYQAKLIPFKDSFHSKTIPYSPKEFEELIKRAHLCFFSLAGQLITHAIDNKTKIPPLTLLAEIDKDKEGSIQTIDISIAGRFRERNNKKSSVPYSSPFNIAMSSAYVLMCFYTAFNDSTIHQIRNPIEVITNKNEGRVSRHVTIKAFKSRANSQVSAIVSSSFSDIDSVYAVVDKKDGLTFIKVLSKLSELYSLDQNERLIYALSHKNDISSFDVSTALRSLSTALNLLSDTRSNIADYTAKQFYNILTNRCVSYVSLENLSGESRVKVTTDSLSLRSASIYACYFSFATISCLTDLNITNALIPLTYKPNINGTTTISVMFLDKAQKEFTIDNKYLQVIKDIESYAYTRNKPYSNDNPRIMRPAYLIPSGPINNTEQWSGLHPLKYQILRKTGVRSGDYFLNISSSRIRVTISDKEYKSEENGLTARVLLSHSADIQGKRYLNGNPTENNIIISQGLQILEKLSSSVDIEQAKSEVKAQLQIETLAHDEYLKLRKKTNLNGILCDGNIDLVNEKNEHLAALKFIKKNQILDKHQDISCYQYDLCIFCKSAKVVDDIHSAYKMLSFVECLKDALDHHPDNSEFLLVKINKFIRLIDSNIPMETLSKAKNKLLNEGRYPLLENAYAVSQFI